MRSLLDTKDGLLQLDLLPSLNHEYRHENGLESSQLTLSHLESLLLD